MIYLFKVTHCGIFQQMVCRMCQKPSDSHDLCRGHAYCGGEGAARYHSMNCLTCRDLWEVAEDLDMLDDAQLAFGALDRWVTGFRRNSRNRQPGESHFVDPEERRNFERLYARHRAAGYAPRSSSLSSSFEVSLSELVFK